MNIKTEQQHLDRELTLWENAQSFLPFHVATLSFTQQDHQPIECRLTGQVDADFYHQIDTKALFNLKPEIRGAHSAGDFQADTSIQIEITLKPDCLSDLASHATTAETAAHYLLTLSQATPNHPLLHTENWLALTVTQAQPTGKVGYSTLWATLNPAALAAGTLTEADLAPALTQFFSDWTTANLGSLTETTTAQILTEVGNFFNDLADTSIDALTELSTELAPANSSSDTLLSQIITFFTTDDWSFTKLQGEPALRLAFQGENGEWACYARAREEQQQFIFYSICPIAAPEDKRGAIAEFLTRANYGMTIGNFELDYADGEIRYKTSIDVTNDQLSPALIQTLVYTNVAMMDEYLPGIQAIIEDGMGAEAAITLVEQPNP
jgi:hypothetical protein